MKKVPINPWRVLLGLMFLVVILAALGTCATHRAKGVISNAYAISHTRLLFIELDPPGVSIALAHDYSNQVRSSVPRSQQTSRVWFHKRDDVDPVIFLGHGDANASPDPNVHWNSAPSIVLYIQPILGWILFCVMFVIAGVRWLRANRFPPGFCRGCGYDLRASPERCPECGRYVDPAERRPIKTPSA